MNAADDDRRTTTMGRGEGGSRCCISKLR